MLRNVFFQSGDAAAGGSVPSEEHPAPLGRRLQTVCDVSHGRGGGAFTVASWSSQGCSPCCQTWAQRPRVGLTDTSPVLPHSCDWNRYNLQYALAVSKQRGLKRPSEPPGSEEAAGASEDDDDDSLHLLGGGPGHADAPLA